MSRRKRLPEGEFAADILDLDHEGRGVARIDGKVTFIADALPGERVRFVYRQRTRHHDEGQCVGVEQASADRVEPGCAHFGVCGGCSMQHLAPERQIEFKQKQLLDQLERSAKVVPETVAPALRGPLWGYRRRARLGVKLVTAKNRVLVGFRERGTHFLAQLERCPVLDPRVGEKLVALGELIAGLSIASRMPQIEIACAERVSAVMRLLELPNEEDRARLAEFAEREGYDFYLQPGGPSTVTPLLPPARPLTFSPDGSALSLAFTPVDFVQVNAELNKKMVRQALDWLDLQPGARVLELFCGLGNFSLPLAAAGARVTAVEGEALLVQRARDNAQRNALDIRFEVGDLFKTPPDIDWLQQDYDAVLLDPPRAGAREILPLIAVRAPRRIVYVSCHPGTLARDAQTLVHEHGYRLVRAGVMDMFPHTSHVESMALFIHKDA